MARGVSNSQPLASSSSSSRTARSTQPAGSLAPSTSNAGNAKVLDDPVLLLARGYTARFLGANISTSLLTLSSSNVPSSTTSGGAAGTSSSSGLNNSTGGNSSGAVASTSLPRKIQPLTNEEIEKDLRHITAYQAACQRYHQQYYLALNQIPPGAAVSSGGVSTVSGVVGGNASVTTTTGPKSSSSQLSQQHPSHPQLHHHSQSSVMATASSGSVTVHGGLVVGSAGEYAALPIRLDPEEEKRLQAQRKKIARAEYIREGLEQHYVAVRAHYVEACHKLQDVQASTRNRVAFLQDCVKAAAQRVAWQRCRVQVARDILKALQYRAMVLASSSVSPTAATQLPVTSTTDLAATVTNSGTGVATSSNGGTNTALESDQQDALYNVWIQIDEEGKHQIAADAKEQKISSAKAILWPARTAPATLRGVPLLLSAASEVPERSVAWSSGGIFGSHQHSLTWFSRHLPMVAPGSDEGAALEDDNRGEGLENSSASSNGMEQLREEVLFMEQELLREQELNVHILKETGKARASHDEWVAMMVLVRQETESILHRHNVLLESDTAVKAATRLAAEHHMQQQEQQAQQRQQAQQTLHEPCANDANSDLFLSAPRTGEELTAETKCGTMEEPLQADDAITATGVAALAFAANEQQQQDEAHYGDDEGDEEGDDDENNGSEGSGGGNKRDAGGSESDPHNPGATSRKRRKV